jgi:hypothetical protein
MKFYNVNPSYTLRKEHVTEFYKPKSKILDTSTAICKYTLVHCSVFRSHILMVLSLSPDTIFWSSYCRQYTPLEFSDLQLILCRTCLPILQLFSIL